MLRLNDCKVLRRKRIDSNQKKTLKFRHRLSHCMKIRPQIVNETLTIMNNIELLKDVLEKQ